MSLLSLWFSRIIRSLSFLHSSVSVLILSLCLTRKLCNLSSLCSAVSIAVLSICLSRIIFNLSSLCSAVSTSLISLYLSRSRALSVSLLLRNLTSFSSLVSAAHLALSLSLLLLIHNEQCKHMAFSNFIDKIKRYLRNTRIKIFTEYVRNTNKHYYIYTMQTFRLYTSLVWGSLRLAPINL